MPPAAPSWRGGWFACVVSAASRALLAALAGLAFWSLAPAALGWTPSVVMSGSMSPRIQPGDVVVTRPVPVRHLRPGQVLLVDDPDHAGRLRLHRLVAVDPDGDLVLRGDANPGNDSTPVAPSAVHGVGSLRVPLIGRPALWLATGDARSLALAATGLLLLAAAAVAHRRDSDDVDDDPALPGPQGPVGMTRGRLARVAAAAVLLAGAGTAARPAAEAMAAAGFVTTTSDTGNAWSATAYFTCRAAAVTASPYLYYPLAEAAGPTAVDDSGNNRAGTYQGSGTTYGESGPCTRDATTAVALHGTGWVSTPASVTNPTVFTLETWFRTTTTTGGELIGFANSQLSQPTNYDRHLYLANSGQLVFGVYPSVVKTVVSPRYYNDGAWHHAAATLSSAGMRLYVDGTVVASDPGTTTAQNYTGYWRVGNNSLDKWGPTTPTSFNVDASLAHVAIYGYDLSASEVAAHYNAR